jgi:RNA polymerase sigma-70 factor (ECF subfamily)
MINFQTDILPLKNQLYRLALRITLDSAEAEDIVQETLIKVWDKRDSWTDIENIEAFCYTICRNKALDYVKSQGSQSESLDASQTERPDSSYTPSQQTIANDEVEMVRNIVNTLPEKQRSCIQLRDFEGKPYKDIARLLNMTEEQVKINIFRGRKTIKERFEQMNNYRA